MLGVYIGTGHLVSAVGLFVRVREQFLRAFLFVMGFFGVFVVNIAYYGLQRMLDVLSSVILRLSHHVLGRWLGDTTVAPRNVVSAGGDTEVIPRSVRSDRFTGAVDGVRGAACVHCLVDVESQVDGEGSLVVDLGGSSDDLAEDIV